MGKWIIALNTEKIIFSILRFFLDLWKFLLSISKKATARWKLVFVRKSCVNNRHTQPYTEMVEKRWQVLDIARSILCLFVREGVIHCNQCRALS